MKLAVEMYKEDELEQKDLEAEIQDISEILKIKTLSELELKLDKEHMEIEIEQLNKERDEEVKKTAKLHLHWSKLERI